MAALIADRLALDVLEPDVFASRDVLEAGHVFGGLVMAHALRAAASTVAAPHGAHAFHASFLIAGTGGERIRYEVERTRDGSSFTTRRVVARQDRGVVLIATADFHGEEAGPDYELPASSDVPRPEGLPVGRYDSAWFESRDVPREIGSSIVPHVRRAWFRPTAPVPDDPQMHLQALLYVTDSGPTRAAREPHPELADDAQRMSVSLNHNVWFHRGVDVNDWLLVEIAPVATGRARGLTLGSVRAGGALVATFAQETLLRSRRRAP